MVDAVLDFIRTWGASFCQEGNEPEALSEEQMTDFRYLVQETMVRRDTTLMNDILEAISPAVAWITTHPRIRNQPVWLRQAIEVSTLRGVIGGVSCDLRFARSEKDFEASPLHTMILKAIAALAQETTEEGYKILKENPAKQIEGWLQKSHSKKLSISAISHAVRALDRSGFIMRLGPSKSRRFVLMHKGADLIEKERLDARESSVAETPMFLFPVFLVPVLLNYRPKWGMYARSI